MVRNGIAPGTQSAGSNSGCTRLAAVVEEASGAPWTKYLRDELFVPAGLKSTGLFGEACFRQDSIAIGRGKRVERKNDPDEWLLTWSLMGNGGIVSTVAVTGNSQPLPGALPNVVDALLAIVAAGA